MNDPSKQFSAFLRGKTDRPGAEEPTTPSQQFSQFLRGETDQPEAPGKQEPKPDSMNALIRALGKADPLFLSALEAAAEQEAQEGKR